MDKEKEAIAIADQKTYEELDEAKVALEIGKKVADTPEEATEREKLIEQIDELQKRLDETIGERDRYKKERDEANSNLREMNAEKEDEKSEFDELFGGDR